jgi:hypothetical protein
MTGYSTVFALAVLGIFLVIMALIYSGFASECRAHGGAHTTYPYKALPECWDAEGRRVFW